MALSPSKICFWNARQCMIHNWWTYPSFGRKLCLKFYRKYDHPIPQIPSFLHSGVQIDANYHHILAGNTHKNWTFNIYLFVLINGGHPYDTQCDSCNIRLTIVKDNLSRSFRIFRIIFNFQWDIRNIANGVLKQYRQLCWNVKKIKCSLQ